MPVDANTYLGWERNSEIGPRTGLPDHKESLQVRCVNSPAQALQQQSSCLVSSLLLYLSRCKQEQLQTPCSSAACCAAAYTRQAGMQLTHAQLASCSQVAYDQRGWGSDWPTDACVPGFRKQTLAFMHKCHDLCLYILECFAEGLGLPLDSFAKAWACVSSAVPPDNCSR